MGTVSQLGQLVKKKFPGEYDDLVDQEVGVRVKAKYPGSYDDYIDPVPKAGLWNRATTGLIPPERISPQGVTEEVRRRGPMPGQSPTDFAMETFAHGVSEDLGKTMSSFTSPLSIGTMALGPLGKVPGAVGTIARIAEPVVATGFGIHGASEMMTPRQPGEDLPEEIRRRLTGASQAIIGGIAPGKAVYQNRALATQAAKGARSILIGPDIKDIPSDVAFIKSTKPRNSIKNIRDTIQTGMPDARRAADALGLDLETMTLQDAEKAVVQAKNDIWGEFESHHLGPNASIPISTNPVAARVQQIVSRMTEVQKRRLNLIDQRGNPNYNHKIYKAMDDYQGKNFPLRDINVRIQELNNQLRSQQAQFKVSEMALRHDPKFSALYAELDGLRDIEANALNQLSGPGAKDLKIRYGAQKVMEDVISRRINVAERAAPVPVFQGLGRMAGLGNVAGGTWQTITGHPEIGLPNVIKGGVQIRAGQNAQHLNDPHALIQQAFKSATPRPPISPTPPPRP